MTNAAGTITVTIAQLKSGDPDAAQKLWDRYCQRLARIARRMLGDASRTVADEEDVASMAFYSFCEGAVRGEFPELANRHDLWSLLVAISRHKAADLKRFLNRKKRRAPDEVNSLDQVACSKPLPHQLSEFIEVLDLMLDGLQDDQLRQIVGWRLEDHTIQEIAQRLDCSTRTINRKLTAIRKLCASLIDTREAILSRE